MTYEYYGGADRDLYGQPNYGYINGLKRRGSRLVYDLPSDLVRIQAGDTDTLATGFQNGNSVLGLSIEKSPRKLAPNENIRPTGRGSFHVDRPAEVDVVVNGAVMQHLQLRPGAYNLSELPLGTGANELELIITDETGQRRSLTFTTYFDEKLLAAGTSEWAITGGVPSIVSDDQVSYLNEQWLASGFYRQGLTDATTGEVHLQGDGIVVMGGAGTVFRTPVGIFGMHAAVSDSSWFGVGYAASLGWDLVNFNGLLGEESLHLSAQYRSPGFAIAGELPCATGINACDPTYFSYLNPYGLRLMSQYSFPIAPTITGTLAARYQFSDDSLNPAIASYEVTGDLYGADLTVSVPVAGSTTMSLTAGYSNEPFNFGGSEPINADGTFRGALRFFIRPDEQTSIAASYDTLDDQSNVSATRIEGEGIDRWETSVNVQYNDDAESAGGNATIAYYGNRFEARVVQSTALDGVGYDSFDVQPSDQRTTVRVGTALVFADGHFGLGAPIRSNGFAIVTPHESIAEKEVTVGAPDFVRARSGALGPAVITDIPAYTPTVLPIDVADLPLGYSLGSGSFDVVAPYRGGYALEVGSSYSVSAFGTLVDADGSPVALLTGVARPADGSDKTVEVFTNAAGRFGAEGLAPGRWLIEMASEPVPTRYVIDIPEGTEGLFRAGVLEPASGG